MIDKIINEVVECKYRTSTLYKILDVIPRIEHPIFWTGERFDTSIYGHMDQNHLTKSDAIMVIENAIRLREL